MIVTGTGRFVAEAANGIEKAECIDREPAGQVKPRDLSCEGAKQCTMSASEPKGRHERNHRCP
jgi:hypothetical protein